MSTEINTEYVRKVYARCPVDSLNGGAPNPTPDFAAAQFDTWLVDHDRQVAERAGAQALATAAEDPYWKQAGYDSADRYVIRQHLMSLARSYRADSLAPRPAAPGVSVSRDVLAMALARRERGLAWEKATEEVRAAWLREADTFSDLLAALGVTVTDGGA